jgi:hypothetical protein
MKTKLGFLVAISLLLAASAWASKWAVDSFDNSPDPGEPDNYIAEEFSGGLKPVKPEQVTQQGGRLYVRQKFEDPFGDEEATYQIFQGRPKEAAKDLGRISVEGMPYTTLLKMKLFYTKTASGDDDLETVYFDGKDIFVEGEDPVYINLNGKMEELKPVVSREYKISITSDPPGATVTVGNASKGETPVTFPASSNKTISVVVSKEGYYTVIKPITPSDKQTTQEGILLTARLPLENPAEAFRARLRTAVAAKDGNAIKTIKNEIQQALKNYNADSKKSIDAVMSKFPANPPKASSETANDYSARQNLWTNTQAKERDALNKEAANYFNELKELSAEADGAAGDMDFALKYEYIPSSAISFTNMGVRDFTIDAELQNSRVNFKYGKAKLGYGSVPRNELAQNEENVHGVLKIWNAPNENGKYASIYDAAFFYNETPLQVLSKGTFTSGDATTASRNTEKDLNGRIAKYPGKAAWDKKDQAATLEALRAGEIPDATAVAKPSADEAYYDEDEDEEEFEDEAEEQEKYDYSRHGAVGSATDIFGNTDEYLFWAGVVFAVAAVGTGVVGYLEHQKWQKADEGLSTIKGARDDVMNLIKTRCNNDKECENKYILFFTTPGNMNPISPDPNNPYPADLLNDLDKRKKTNEDIKNKRNMNRIIWFSAAGVSAAISITLFAW